MKSFYKLFLSVGLAIILSSCSSSDPTFKYQAQESYVVNFSEEDAQTKNAEMVSKSPSSTSKDQKSDCDQEKLSGFHKVTRLIAENDLPKVKSQYKQGIKNNRFYKGKKSYLNKDLESRMKSNEGFYSKIEVSSEKRRSGLPNNPPSTKLYKGSYRSEKPTDLEQITLGF